MEKKKQPNSQNQCPGKNNDQSQQNKQTKNKPTEENKK